MSPYKKIDPLTTDQAKVLVEMVEGGARIQARREFPHPHKYELVNRGLRHQMLLPDIPVQAGTVGRLIHLRLIDPTPRDKRLDAIDYVASENGLPPVLRGAVHEPEGKQTAFFADVR